VDQWNPTNTPTLAPKPAIDYFPIPYRPGQYDSSFMFDGSGYVPVHSDFTKH
jgi:hypothetical protein